MQRMIAHDVLERWDVHQLGKLVDAHGGKVSQRTYVACVHITEEIFDGGGDVTINERVFEFRGVDACSSLCHGPQLSAVVIVVRRLAARLWTPRCRRCHRDQCLNDCKFKLLLGVESMEIAAPVLPIRFRPCLPMRWYAADPEFTLHVARQVLQSCKELLGCCDLGRVGAFRAWRTARKDVDRVVGPPLDDVSRA